MQPQYAAFLGSELDGDVPLAEMANFASELRSITGGRGDFHMEQSHYDEVPRNVQEKIVAESKPSAEEEEEIVLATTEAAVREVQAVSSLDEIAAIQQLVRAREDRRRLVTYRGGTAGTAGADGRVHGCGDAFASIGVSKVALDLRRRRLHVARPVCHQMHVFLEEVPV